uniref:Ribosomal RNA small subunit methyltransferase H n=1 Tax=Candidatus Actinomarina minuta TaxID=1389454 RepID=S5DLD7_9ACTN|nr:putative S-adenosylmethionine-dependent methyltransferase [Candidatus Actinomarina minuta]
MPHIGVMKEEISSILDDVPPGIFIDSTYGYGSHFDTIIKHSQLTPIGFDRDLEAVDNSDPSHEVINLNFSKISDYVNNNSLSPISGILYDLGVSSHQIDTPNRGFSFSIDSNLDMRMNQKDELTAQKVLNTFSYENLYSIFSEFGEERYSKSIAKKIIENRPINKTIELSNIIKNSVPKQNPIFIEKSIRRIFQSLRIYINDELNELKESLLKVKDLIQKNGVIICISYHSLEDRIIKNFMKDLTLGCICDPSIAICVCNNIQIFEYPKRKKYYPNKEEINSNSRANSATLRYVRKI